MNQNTNHITHATVREFQHVRSDTTTTYYVDDGHTTYPLGPDLVEAIAIRDKHYRGLTIYRSIVTTIRDRFIERS